MAYFDTAIRELLNNDYSKYNGYAGDPPTSETEYNALKADNKLCSLAKVRDTAEGMFPDGVTAPTWAEVTAKIAEETVRETRKVAYLPIEEQLDMQYKDALNGTTTWKDAITKIKADNPKP